MEDTMFRILLTAPGKLIKETVSIPEPKADEVRVAVRRVGICGSDPTIFRGLHPYVTCPLVMGHEFSGYVDKLGDGVVAPLPGSRVTVIPHLTCGTCPACQQKLFNFCESLRCVGAEADGALCEYICMPREMVLPVPDSMSLEEAAMVEPACVAWHGAKRGEVRKDDVALIIGAGPIGLFCFQCVRALGSEKILIADFDSHRLAVARELGADGVIDRKRETLDQGVKRLVKSVKNVSLFYDCVGGKGEVLNELIMMARRGSRIVMVGVLQNGYVIPNLPDFVQHELRLSGTTMYTPADYREMIDLMGKKIIRTDGIITHHFSLAETIQVFETMIAQRKEPFLKIMLTNGD